MALFLKEADVKELLNMKDALELVESAMAEHGSGAATNVPREVLRADGASLSILPGAVPSLASLGFKAYTTCRDGVRFWVFLFGTDGELKAIMEAEHLGMVRTGAASGVATKYLSREESDTVAILGTGYQAPAQLEAVCAVRPVERVKAFSRTRANLQRFCGEMAAKLGVPVEPSEDAESAVRDADIVITITSSKEPVLFGRWLKPGVHLNLAGAMKPSSREVDDATLARAARLVVDDWSQSHREAGELIEAASQGVVSWSDVRELSAVVAGSVQRRESSHDITLFKSHGIGLWDVAVAAHVHEVALARQVGATLPIEQAPIVLGGGKDPDRLKV